MRAEDRVRLCLAVDVERDKALRIRLLVVGKPQCAQLPPARRAREHARPLRCERLPYRREELECLCRRHEARPPGPLERARERGPFSLDLHVALPRRDAVAEPAVDRLLARPQCGDRLAALVHVLQLRVHHRAQDTAPAMRRIDTDDGDARAPQRPTGNGEVVRERARAADDLAVLACSVHPLQVEHLREAAEPLLIRHRAEVLPDPEDRAAVLLQIGGGANLERHDRGE